MADNQKELAAARDEIESLRKENLELRARLGMNSQNSSKPPSSDPPGTPKPSPKKKRKKKKRKRGGQKGHTANFSVTPDHVDEVIQYRPSDCQHCHADLSNGNLTSTCFNHYVYSLPEIRPIVKDHQSLGVQCPNCGKVTHAELPSTVPQGQYDPSVQAMMALIRGELRQSVRQTSAVMTKIFHVPMSTGMVAKTQEQVSQALEEPHSEALTYAHTYARPHADETGWSQDKKKAWLWVSLCAVVAVFLIRVSRNALAAKDLIGKSFQGILTTDRWNAYNWVGNMRRQFCWSHLKRDLKSFLDHGPEAFQIGSALLRETRKMFRAWNKVRDGTKSKLKFKLYMKPVRRRILALLEEGTYLPSKKVRGVCEQILKFQQALFTFVDEEGLEPTNNVAERAVRYAVLWRKGCFGSDSEKGGRFVERFLTVRATLKNQNLVIYKYIMEACTAKFLGHCAPRLLPDTVCNKGELLAAA